MMKDSFEAYRVKQFPNHTERSLISVKYTDKKYENLSIYQGKEISVMGRVTSTHNAAVFLDREEAYELFIFLGDIFKGEERNES